MTALQRLRFIAEGVLADAQLAEPALLGLDVHVAARGHLLCRSGRGDARPRADIVLDEKGALLLFALPEGVTSEQEFAVVQLTLALQRALKPSEPAREREVA